MVLHCRTHVYALQELLKFANSSIADHNIQASPSLHYGFYHLLSRLRVAYIAWYFYHPLLCFVFAKKQVGGGFLDERLILGSRLLVAEVVHRDVCAVLEVSKDDGATNARYAACDHHGLPRQESRCLGYGWSP
jgi:hypothetical protein